MSARPEHCFHCFETLESTLARTPVQGRYDFEDLERALFVTWNTLTSRGASLRGCIGTFSPCRIRRGLADYAITAALRDSRFRPITLEELPRLECGVSLLSPFEACERWDDWEIGTHGIYITFTSDRSDFSATYLPDVMPEQGWTKEEAVRSAIKKSGYRGSVSEVFSKVEVQRYTSSKAKASWKDYQSAMTSA